MTDPDAVQALALGELSIRCCREMDNYRAKQPNAPAFCVELLRRALHTKLEEAWNRVLDLHGCIANYLRGKLHHHRSWATARRYQVEEHYLLDAFARLWRANETNPRRIEPFAAFLAYLYQCLHCAILDEIRFWEPPDRRGKRPSAAKPSAAEDEHADRTALQHWPAPVSPRAEPVSAQNPFIDVVRRERLRHVWECARSEDERRLFFRRWIQGYPPRELVARWPKDYESTTQIDQMLQKILARYYRLSRREDV